MQYIIKVGKNMYGMAYIPIAESFRKFLSLAHVEIKCMPMQTIPHYVR